MSKKEKKITSAEISKRAKDLQKRIEKDIQRQKRLKSLMEASPETYRALMREEGYRAMEKQRGEPVQRFRRKGETELLNRLADFTKQYKRSQLK